MKHKVEELEGALLDAAVAKAEGRDIRRWRGIFRPSESWAFAGPIIERERICPQWSGPRYLALVHRPGGAMDDDMVFEGSTYLECAMRAYVASKFGEEVELP